MIRILKVAFVVFILVGCANTKHPTLRETAISLIEKKFQVDGRRLEYSQIDSSDAELKGYSICRIYIDNNDSIRMDIFHLNYKETNVNRINSYTIDTDLYKLFILSGKVFTNDLHSDMERISMEYDKFHGIERPFYCNDSIDEQDRIRIADSIACQEAASAVAALNM